MPTGTPQGARPFDTVAADLMADQFAANPVLASALGAIEHDARLPDLSAEGIAAAERREDEWAQRLRDLPDHELTGDERIDRDLALMVLRGRELQRGWADWRRSADHYAGTALTGVFSLLLNRLRPEPELAEVVAARLRATPELLEQGMANLDPQLAHPALLRRGLGQIGAGVAYSRSVADEFADGPARTAVAEAGEQAAAAFERYGSHVEALVEKATGEWAIGEARYDALLREAEGLSYGTRELREKGQAAYDDLAADMTERSRLLRGTDDFLAVLRDFNDDHPDTPEEMLALYREATDAARAFCVERDLVTMPAGERCVVAPSAPFTRAMLAVAHYMQPPPFAPAPPEGARPGHFFVPYPPDGATPEQVTARLATNNRHGAWSIAVHEAYPGHHWHFAWLAANAASGGARPLRFVFGSTYFVEGWGLYAEDLLREQGFFGTPEQVLAQRDYRLFRAARIIVDTSLHLGEMTIEEGVDFMATRTSLSRETAHAEVLRYCAWPTQASSYLTGAMEIARMRRRWEDEDRGSLREFHDRAAGSGRLPIGLVERALFR
ncbi:MAG TPA: DUF885 domain-containing protein [Actinomycetes bacterium]|nr:DUF885 domain-containing protein [Actinomycetes bacterium]